MSLSQDIFLSSPTSLLQGGTVELDTTAKRNAWIDALPAIVEAAGWTNGEPQHAMYYLNILALASGAGFYSQIMLLDGHAFSTYNPLRGELPMNGSDNYSWPGGPYPNVGVLTGHPDYQDDIQSLATAISTYTSFDAVVVPPIPPFYDGRILVTSRVGGSGGNDHQLITSGHSVFPEFIQGGGWKYRSALANGISYMEAAWANNEFGNFCLTITLNGNQGPVYPFYMVKPYFYSIGPYHFLLAGQQNHTDPEAGDLAGVQFGGYAYYAAVPYVPTDHPRTYAGFGIPLEQDKLHQVTRLQTAIDAAYRFGSYSNGETGFAWNSLYGYEETDLFLSNGQPILLSPFVGMATADLTERRIVGATFDSFITPALYDLDTLIDQDGRRYIAAANTTSGQRSTFFIRLPADFHYQD